jgi:hypothetical protein
LPPCKTGSKPGKKALTTLDAYLDWALSDFSGYLSADEMYDGPFCVLSIVDNRTYKRLCYQVLDHDPTHEDIVALFRPFQAALAARGLTLKGITTDGSKLYPAAMAEVFGSVPHQICEFHVLADITRAVLGAVTTVRKQLDARKPKLPCGRPSHALRLQVRLAQRLEQQKTDLFKHRFLFVQRELTESERATLQRLTRGLPQLRDLRAIMEEVYRLFDRRCRTQTALAKLAQLRARVQRLGQVGQALRALFSSNLEKALTFLDDRLLPATSNAVERSNRRIRKLQKSIYCVRTEGHLSGRIALDFWRAARALSRKVTLDLLHQARTALVPIRIL